MYLKFIIKGQIFKSKKIPDNFNNLNLYVILSYSYNFRLNKNLRNICHKYIILNILIMKTT